MDERILTAIVPGIGLVSGLIATYVSLQNRALLAEVRKELAESRKPDHFAPERSVHPTGRV